MVIFMQFLIALIWLLPLLLMVISKKVGVAHAVVRDDLNESDTDYSDRLRLSIRTERIFLLIYALFSWCILLLAELAIASNGLTDQVRYVPLIAVVAIGIAYVTRSWMLISDHRKILRAMATRTTREDVS